MMCQMSWDNCQCRKNISQHRIAKNLLLSPLTVYNRSTEHSGISGSSSIFKKNLIIHNILDFHEWPWFSVWSLPVIQEQQLGSDINSRGCVSLCWKAAYEIRLRSEAEGCSATNGLMWPPDCVHFRATQAHPLPTRQLMQLHPRICRGLPLSPFPSQPTALFVILHV